MFVSGPSMISCRITCGFDGGRQAVDCRPTAPHPSQSRPSGTTSGCPLGNLCHWRKWVGFTRHGNRRPERSATTSASVSTYSVRGIGMPCRDARVVLCLLVGEQSLQGVPGRQEVVLGQHLRVGGDGRHELVRTRDQRRLPWQRGGQVHHEACPGIRFAVRVRAQPGRTIDGPETRLIRVGVEADGLDAASLQAPARRARRSERPLRLRLAASLLAPLTDSPPSVSRQ